MHELVHLSPGAVHVLEDTWIRAGDHGREYEAG